MKRLCAAALALAAGLAGAEPLFVGVAPNGRTVVLMDSPCELPPAVGPQRRVVELLAPVTMQVMFTGCWFMDSNRLIQIEWQDGDRSVFPIVVLRPTKGA